MGKSEAASDIIELLEVLRFFTGVEVERGIVSHGVPLDSAVLSAAFAGASFG